MAAAHREKKAWANRAPPLALAVFLTALTLFAPTTTAAQDDRQYKLEAVFLYNFFNYITWPGYTSPADLHDATICIYANDPLAPYLKYVQQKMAGERKLTVRELHAGQPASGCHVLFDRRGSGNPPSDTLSRTLTVSDEQDYLQKGGTIVLSKDGDRIAMDIDNTRLTEQGFQVSSRLLRLAGEVH